METACDASVLWNDPGRFRFVCPRLVASGNGYRCSVNAADVRPFWGRAGLAVLVATLPLYVAGTTATFIALRAFGNQQLACLDVAWPARWSNIGRARSQYFCAQGIAALQERDLMRARVALASAVEVDRGNYQAALLLAMLQSLGPDSPSADASFQWLIERYPDEAVRSAVVFHDILLANGRPDRLAAFSAWMAGRDTENCAMWVRALLVGLRAHGRAAEFAQAHARELATLPPSARALVAMEIVTQTNGSPATRLAAQRPIDFRASPIYALLQVEQLLRMRQIPAAQVVKGEAVSALGPFLDLALQFCLEQAAGNAPFAQTCFTRLLEDKFDPGHADWLVALLIRAPDRACFRALDARLGSSLPDRDFAPVASGLWLAALACGEPGAASRWARELQTRANLIVPSAKDVSAALLSADNPRALTGVLTALPVPRESIYALYSRLKTSAGASVIGPATSRP